MNGLMAYAIAFGVTAIFGFLLIAKSGRQQRKRSYSGTSNTSSDCSSDSPGFSFSGFFGHSSTDAAASLIDGGADGASDSGGGDSGGGGDGGGGGD